ncbi:hypothetical protein [Legionella brunensis]|uniref:Transmembrane protein n=1 Tax=Legionella brunensis TaxID=29422 RepID=A0A0W0S3C4_9GAMM|nr:hypothetical protein [Legionella brunensis]KTC78031.1 hypothetical protein Lbru_2323 [Legionella brunensis]
MRLLISAIFIVLASIFPLSSYLLSLSFFGAAHIFYELSYIYKHLGSRLPQAFIIIVMSILFFLLLIKTIAIFLPINYLLIIEISFALALVAVALYFKTHPITLLVLLVFAIGIIINPVILFLCLAFLHNLTPWGFLLVEQAASKAWLIFVVSPVIVFGLSLVIVIDPGFYSITQANSYLSHYLVPHGINTLTIAFFATAVYLQLIHYYYVIKVLPKFCKTPIKMNIGFISLFLLLGMGFLYDFHESKKFYSLIAMFHAYLEIPLLLYLLPPRNTDPLLKKIILEKRE